MHPMPHSEAVEVAKRNVCAECGNPLTVAWGGSYGIDGHVVRCGRDVTHEGFEPVLSLTSEYRRGASLPLPIENRLDKRFGGKRMDSVALTKLSPKEMQERVTIGERQFGFALDQWGNPRNLTREDIVYLVEYCRSYGLDPLLREVCLFHGTPYVMIDGLRRKAQETGQYAGVTMTPVTDAEEKKACGYEADDIVFKASVRRVVAGQVAVFERYGGVTQAERKQMSKRGDTPKHPVLNKKGPEMAQNRAERHAIRTAFHFEFPGTETEPSILSVSEPEEEPRPPESQPEQWPPEGAEAAQEEQPVEGEYREVDEETGEILSPAVAAEHADAAGEASPAVSDEEDLLDMFPGTEKAPVQDETGTGQRPELYRCLAACSLRTPDGDCTGRDKMPSEWVIIDESHEDGPDNPVCPWYVKASKEKAQPTDRDLMALDAELRKLMMEQLARFGWDPKENQAEIAGWIPAHMNGKYWRDLDFAGKCEAIKKAKAEADEKEKEVSSGGTGKGRKRQQAQAGHEH